jgi:hypothetical protein
MVITGHFSYRHVLKKETPAQEHCVSAVVHHLPKNCWPLA